MDSRIHIFPPSFIHHPTIQASLPEGLICRPLQRSDFNHGHLTVLRDLAQVGNITEQQCIEQFDDVKKSNGMYFSVVIVNLTRESERMIIDTGTLFVEKKLSVCLLL